VILKKSIVPGSVSSEFRQKYEGPRNLLTMMSTKRKLIEEKMERSNFNSNKMEGKAMDMEPESVPGVGVFFF
jgi:hypothetical protein